jgi:TRAP-type C4-dicarboxylate transport system substrate-binding protein
MNKKKWDSLPKDVQQTIEQVNKEWIDKTGDGWDEFDKIGTEFTLSKGNKIIPLSKEEDEKWAKTVSPVLNEYVEAMKAKGLPGEEALIFCKEWLKKNP